MKKINKSEWVRSFANAIPATDVVAAGKAKGIKLSVAYVYSIRAAAKKAARTKKSAPAAPKREMPKSDIGETAAKPAPSVEDLLFAVASEIGLSSAIALLQARLAKVRELLG